MKCLLTSLLITYIYSLLRYGNRDMLSGLRDNTVLLLNILETAGVLTLMVQNSSQNCLRILGDEFWTTCVRTPVSKMFWWRTYNSHRTGRFYVFSSGLLSISSHRTYWVMLCLLPLVFCLLVHTEIQKLIPLLAQNPLHKPKKRR